MMPAVCGPSAAASASSRTSGRAASMSAVPTMLIYLLNYPEADRFARVSFEVEVGGEKITEGMLQQKLAETTQIIGTVNRFVSFSGRLAPQTSLTTGYDFLADGAQKVKTSFDGRLGAGSTGLISNVWDKSLLMQNLLPATGAPSMVSLNGHADHFRFQPPVVAQVDSADRADGGGESRGDQ